MIGRLPARRWIAAAAAVLAGGAGLAAAQEKPADIRAVDTPPARDALADTKRELDAIRTLRDPAQQPRTDSPRVGTPEWHGPSGGAPAPVLRPARPVTSEAKNANWLVDAMQSSAKDRERDPAGRNLTPSKTPRRDRIPESNDRDSLRTNAERPIDRTTPHEAERRPDEREPDRPAGVDPAAVTNPLTRYLEDWMSPQDFALLAPGVLQPGKSGVETLAVPRPTDTAAGTLFPPGVGVEATFGLRPSAGSPVDSSPRENPFLQSLTLPSAGAIPGMVPPRPPAPAAPIAAPATALNPAPVAPPAPRTPDFARPANDEKYFKPLKRF